MVVIMKSSSRLSGNRGLWSKRTKLYVKHKNEAESYYQQYLWFVLDMNFSHYQKFIAFVRLIIRVISNLSEVFLSGKSLSVQNHPVTPKTPVPSYGGYSYPNG